MPTPKVAQPQRSEKNRNATKPSEYPHPTVVVPYGDCHEPETSGLENENPPGEVAKECHVGFDTVTNSAARCFGCKGTGYGCVDHQNAPVTLYGRDLTI